jgi:hypothetical protein
LQSQSQALHRPVDLQYQARLAALAEGLALAKSKGLDRDDLAQVAQAAAAGQVAKMLIDPNLQTSGRLDRAPGQVEIADLSPRKPMSDSTISASWPGRWAGLGATYGE